MRKKVKLAFIDNDSARKISYKKRKMSLIKKIDELTILCGIDACAIVYSDFDPQPEVWPSPWEVQRVVSKLKTYSEFEQGRKMLNQESFLKQRVLKGKEQLEKVKKNNREMEMSLLMFQCLIKENFMENLNMVVLNDLAWLIGEKLEEISWRIDELDKKASTTTQSQAQVVDGTTSRQGKEIQVDGGQGFEMNNMDTTQNSSFILNLINGSEIEVQPFGDVNYHKN